MAGHEQRLRVEQEPNGHFLSDERVQKGSPSQAVEVFDSSAKNAGLNFYLRFFPGLKVTVFLPLILIFSPVCGLRPIRVLR